MITIGICDDEPKMQKALRVPLERKLQLLGEEYRIQEYASGEALLAGSQTDGLDILFLDIEMDGLNGMETARSLRRMESDTILIFVTAYPDFVFQGYDVHAFHYILKPYEDRKILEVLEQALKLLGNLGEQYYTVEQKSGILRVPLKHILAFCSDRRKVSILTADGKLDFLIQDLLGVVYFSLDATLFASIFCYLSDAFLHILFWYVLYRLFRQRLFDISRLFDQNTWILLGAVCLASLVSITTVIYYAPAQSYKIWLCALACIITNIGSLCLAGYFSNSIRLEAERNNLKLQQEYYEELERNQTEIRKLRHDMNHHLSVIKDLFYSENRMEAEEYFKEVESQIAVQNRVFCKNSIVNAVLNAKCSQAAGQGIDCFFHVDLHNIQSIDSVSLCSLFSNTLDNAIEASLKVRDPGARKISVKARSTDSGYFSYEISNQKANPIVEKNGHILSDKKDAKSHGLGIRNIREIIDRYNGTLDISYTEDTFTVTMLIRL